MAWGWRAIVKHFPRWLKLMTVVMALMLFVPILAACGSDDDDEEPTATTATGADRDDGRWNR